MLRSCLTLTTLNLDAGVSVSTVGRRALWGSFFNKLYLCPYYDAPLNPKTQTLYPKPQTLCIPIVPSHNPYNAKGCLRSSHLTLSLPASQAVCVWSFPPSHPPHPQCHMPGTQGFWACGGVIILGLYWGYIWGLRRRGKSR